MTGDAGVGRYYRRVAVGTLVPGVGLIRTPWRWLGLALFAAWVAAVVLVVVRVVRGGGPVRAALTLAVDPGALDLLAVLLSVALVLWVGSIVLTAVLEWPAGGGARSLPRALAAVLACALVAGPGAEVVRYLDVQAGLVTEVFSAGSTEGAGGPVGQGTAPVPTPAADPWADIPRVNLVLLGSDAGPDRTGVRTDSMLVVSIDTRTGDTLLVGIPRNLENVPIPKDDPLHALYPNGYDCGDQCLMNGIWTLADDRPDLFPKGADPGRTATVDVIGAVTGLDVSRSVVIDLAGFRELVDAMGGVDVDVRERLCVGCHLTTSGAFAWSTDRHEWIEPGRQHLDGYHALWFARSRATTDDFDRMRRQRCLAGALLEQTDPVRMLARYPAIAKAVRHNVSVDIPSGELPAWVQLVERVQDGGSIRSLPLTNEVVDPGNPDYGTIHRLVAKALRAPATHTPISTPSPDSGSSAPPTTGSTPTTRPSSSASPSGSPDPTRALDLAATC